jgi:hypothetical protein
MYYNYTLEHGRTKIKTKTKLYIVAIAIAIGISGAFALPALAAAPADPGCFGVDRAAYNHDVSQTSGAAPGGSETGKILASRAATNGDQNRAYKTACGGDSTQL